MISALDAHQSCLGKIALKQCDLPCCPLALEPCVRFRTCSRFRIVHICGSRIIYDGMDAEGRHAHDGVLLLAGLAALSIGRSCRNLVLRSPHPMNVWRRDRPLRRCVRDDERRHCSSPARRMNARSAPAFPASARRWRRADRLLSGRRSNHPPGYWMVENLGVSPHRRDSAREASTRSHRTRERCCRRLPAR